MLASGCTLRCVLRIALDTACAHRACSLRVRTSRFSTHQLPSFSRPLYFRVRHLRAHQSGSRPQFNQSSPYASTALLHTGAGSALTSIPDWYVGSDALSVLALIGTQTVQCLDDGASLPAEQYLARCAGCCWETELDMATLRCLPLTHPHVLASHLHYYFFPSALLLHSPKCWQGHGGEECRR